LRSVCIACSPLDALQNTAPNARNDSTRPSCVMIEVHHRAMQME
jgi:hypothetical protein